MELCAGWAGRCGIQVWQLLPQARWEERSCMHALGSVQTWLREGDGWGQYLVPEVLSGVRETVYLCLTVSTRGMRTEE